ncbi:CATRA system-associated protein [Streptomyces sp. NPDC059696]|uniref:CATRA system-associated protein n=1 Tax=Streptomyces sp. NPDC059696 TaxID=3346911 RepID=UPI00368293DD
MTGLDVALREASTALALLRDARLPATRWGRVEAVVTRLEEAMRDSDADAVLGAARNLEDHCSHWRARRAAEPESTGPPPVLEERVNRLIHDERAASTSPPPSDPDVSPPQPDPGQGAPL